MNALSEIKRKQEEQEQLVREQKIKASNKTYAGTMGRSNRTCKTAK
jgi:hypothetical protein